MKRNLMEKIMKEREDIILTSFQVTQGLDELLTNKRTSYDFIRKLEKKYHTISKLKKEIIKNDGFSKNFSFLERYPISNVGGLFDKGEIGVGVTTNGAHNALFLFIVLFASPGGTLWSIRYDIYDEEDDKVWTTVNLKDTISMKALINYSK